MGDLPNIYAYACNNPSESILAKRRGYGTLVSYNVPPYGRAGLYMELASLKELLEDADHKPADDGPGDRLEPAEHEHRQRLVGNHLQREGDPCPRAPGNARHQRNDACDEPDQHPDCLQRNTDRERRLVVIP